MSATDRVEPPDAGRDWRSAFVTLGLAMGVSAGLLDVGFRLLMLRIADATAMSFAPLAATVVFVWLAAAISAIGLSLIRRDRRHAFRAFLAASMFWGILVPVTNFCCPADGLLPQTAPGWLAVVLTAALAAIAGRWCCMVLARPGGRAAGWLSTFGPVGLPFVSALVLLWACINTAWRSAPPVGVLLAVAILAGAALVACLRAGRPASAGSTVHGVNLLALAAVFIPFALHARPEASQAAPGRTEVPLSVRRVILLSVDTLRTDALSCYGGSTPTPNVDRIAQDAVVFERAISPAPWTLPAFASMMTGVYPDVHGATEFWSRVPLDLTTLAERLSAAGYTTAAIGDNAFLTADTNMGQGFAEYHFSSGSEARPSFGARLLQCLFPSRYIARATSKDLTQMACRWLERNRDRRFFLWLHYFDPHLPYSPPPEFMPAGTPPRAIGAVVQERTPVVAGHIGRTVEEREWIKALYLGEVRYVDACIGEVLGTLKRLGLYDDTLLVFVSDHGEEFWEHGGFEHGHSLYDEVIHVPLMIKLPRPREDGSAAAAGDQRFVDDDTKTALTTAAVEPQHGLAAPRVVSCTVSTAALMPTVLDLCGIPYNAEELSVRSLAPLLAHPDSAPRVVYSGSPLYYENRLAVLLSGTKYIWSAVTEQEELYDLSHDPHERTPLAASRDAALLDFRHASDAYLHESDLLRQQLGLTSERAVLSSDRLEQLKSLGYVQ